MVTTRVIKDSGHFVQENNGRLLEREGKGQFIQGLFGNLINVISEITDKQ